MLFLIGSRIKVPWKRRGCKQKSHETSFLMTQRRAQAQSFLITIGGIKQTQKYKIEYFTTVFKKVFKLVRIVKPCIKGENFLTSWLLKKSEFSNAHFIDFNLSIYFSCKNRFLSHIIQSARLAFYSDAKVS